MKYNTVLFHYVASCNVNHFYINFNPVTCSIFTGNLLDKAGKINME